MKAQLESNSNHHHANVLGIRTTESKIQKAPRHNKEEENEEIKAYLTKLQEIVPFMPKHKKLSKLEVITYVIDYIRDLRLTLGMPPSSARVPSIPSMMMEDDLCPSSPLEVLPTSGPAHTSLNSLSAAGGSSNRTPLSLIPLPNNTSSSSCGSQEIPQLMDKSPSSEVDTRPVSC